MSAERNRVGAVSLAVAAAGFLFVSLQPWLPLERVPILGSLTLRGLLAALFDAALVGALADWFAVTALFRRPLGIPLPHTAILAHRKDAVAEAVPRFLSGFVSDDRVAEELARVDFAGKLDEALSRDELRGGLREFLRERLAALLAGAASEGREPGSARRASGAFVADLFDFAVENLDAAAAFSGLLEWARRGGLDERLLETAADRLRTEMGRNRFKLAAAITPIVRRNAGWQGLFIGKGTIEGLLVGIEDELAQFRSDKGHELRRHILRSLGAYAERLSGSGPEGDGERRRFEEAAKAALRDESLRTAAVDFVADLAGRLGADLGKPDSRFIAAVERAESSILRRVGEDPLVRARFNEGTAGLLAGFVARSRLLEGLTAYLIDLLKATEPTYFVQRVEEAVWNDLQYIRLNGAVVGGLAGVALALIAALAGR